MNKTTEFLFNLNKITGESLVALLIEAHIQWARLQVRDIHNDRLFSAHRTLTKLKLSPDVLLGTASTISLDITRNMRVYREMWYKGQTIKRSLPELIDILTRHINDSC